MNYDFIEIGTSDFDTCIQSSNAGEAGLSIEPLKVYLDRLPDKPNVTKLNCAISLDGTEYKDKIYWIHPDDLAKNGLPGYIKGCNRIGEPHIQHLTDRVKNTNAEVLATEIDMIPLSKIFDDYNVEGVKILKLDTEGADVHILKSFLPYLSERPKEHRPDEIFFEANQLTADELVLEVIDLYKDMGYRMAQRTYQNVRLIKV
jgi:hypothetical protein